MSCGGYPMGAEYDRRAPWNEKEPHMRTCPECGGAGHFYWIENVKTGNQFCATEEEYRKRPVSFEAAKKHGDTFFRSGTEPCEVCGATGQVEDENPYEYSDDDRDDFLSRKYNIL